MAVKRPIILNAGVQAEATNSDYLLAPTQAIADWATTPNPGTTGALCWSSTTQSWMTWDGSHWVSEATRNYTDSRIVSPPAMYGLISMNYNPGNSSSTNVPTGGTLNMVKLFCPPASITDISLLITGAGATLTAGRNFAGLFTFATGGARLAASVDQATAWQSTGEKLCNLASPYTFAGGYIYVGFYAVGTTIPTFVRGVSGSVQANPGHVTTLPAVGTADTGLTTSLPANLGTMSFSTAVAYCVGLKGTLL